MQPYAVQAHHIAMDYQNGDTVSRVLHDVSIDVEYGKLTMLTGPSGCGKTTLLSIISGILTPTEGEIIVNSHNLNKLGAHQKVLFRRHYLGFIFQQYNLLPSLTAAENAAIPLLADGVPYRLAIQKSKDMLTQVGLQDHSHRLPSQLSGGQQQRVAIARALVHNPQVIVCDEPTAALDEQSGQITMNLLAQCAVDPGRAVLVVTHDNRIFNFAHHMIRMNDGKIISSEKMDAKSSQIPSPSLKDKEHNHEQ